MPRRRSLPVFISASSTAGGVLFRLLFFFLVVFAAASLAWMLFLPALITSQLRARTGFDVSVSTFSANPFTGQMLIRGLVVNNPGEFPVPDFVLLRNFSADVDMWTLAAPTIIFNELDLDVAKVEIVRRAGGQTNSDLFFQRLSDSPPPVAAAGKSPPAVRTSSAPDNSPRKKYLLRKFSLRFDDLVTADYVGSDPVVKDYELRLVQHYVNISDSKQLVVPEVVRSLASANANFHLGDFLAGDFTRAFGGFARDAAVNGREMIKDAGRKTSETVKGIVEKLEDSRKP